MIARAFDLLTEINILSQQISHKTKKNNYTNRKLQTQKLRHEIRTSIEETVKTQTSFSILIMAPLLIKFKVKAFCFKYSIEKGSKMIAIIYTAITLALLTGLLIFVNVYTFEKIEPVKSREELNAKQSYFTSMVYEKKERQTKMSKFSKIAGSKFIINENNTAKIKKPKSKKIEINTNSNSGSTVRGLKEFLNLLVSFEEPKFIVIAFIVAHILYLLSCILLCIGIWKKSQDLITPWIMAEVLRQLVAFATLSAMIWATMKLINDNKNQCNVTLPIAITMITPLMICITAYFWMVVKAHWSHLMSIDDRDEEEGKDKNHHLKRAKQALPVDPHVLELVVQASKEYHSLNRHLDYEKLEKHVLTPSKYFRKFSHNHAIY